MQVFLIYVTILIYLLGRNKYIIKIDCLTERTLFSTIYFYAVPTYGVYL